ncbi:MAG: hypothetical protein M3Q74_00070 [Pseudomonadota bacterium]|nr:hypothetical protein [Pseudomonadota bacterium]
MRVLHLGSIAACLLALACSDGAGVPSEAETIDQFTRDRTGFEATVRTVTADPRIQRIERQPNGELLVLPAGANRDRVASVASFMERHGIIYVSTDRAPEPSVDFTTFEHFGTRYQGS